MVHNSRVLQNQRMNNRISVFERHPYAITKPSTEKSRWQTYVKGSDKRKIVRAATYDKLIEKLFDFYFGQAGSGSMTMDALFREWLSYKESITDSMKTIRRHEQHWNKYFELWREKKVTSYDRLDLQKACNLLVRDNNLSSKEWQNIKTILSGMFEYAYEKKYIAENPMPQVKIMVKYRQVNKKTGVTETYRSDELLKILHYLDSEYARTGDIVLLAVKFDFFVGLRVGELVSLKWDDVLDIKNLHVRSEETKVSFRDGGVWKEEYQVVEHTKTHSDRIIPLVPAAISLLNDIRIKAPCGTSEDDFIFVRDGKRITARQINYALEKACVKLGIPVKRSHKIRKTVASRLNAGNVPLDCIRELLGHSNLNTTLGYIYNPLSEKETYNLMARAL